MTDMYGNLVIRLKLSVSVDSLKLFAYDDSLKLSVSDALFRFICV